MDAGFCFCCLLLKIIENLCISYLLVVCVFLTFLFGAVGSVHVYACFFCLLSCGRKGRYSARNWQRSFASIERL